MLIQKFKGIVSVFVICSLFTVTANSINNLSQTVGTSTNSISYIIDAGHGIPDGGTVGIDGITTEAQLNHAIAQNLSKELKTANIAHQMTRTDENSIFSEGETIHSKKVSDIRNRIAIAQNTPTIPLISIHMNSYPDSSVYGIQVFYGNGEKAQKLASNLQEALNKTFQQDHTKVIKEVSKNVYLYSHVENPVVLIECGFLSNSAELEKLKNKEYQQQLASTIAQILIAHS